MVLIVGTAWWLSRPDPFVAEQAPLVEPVIYGERVLRVVDPDVGLAIDDDAQRGCVLAKVSVDTALVEALGDRPSSSPRFGEVQRLAEACRQQASTAGEHKASFRRPVVALNGGS